jgi:gamma-glutamylcyclotransferase (GGCT)/AIG2-like uncharacterized protein YtfP
MAKLFTYGTLKKGFTNEPLLGDQEYIDKAVLTDAGWLLYEVQGNYVFPALVATEGIYGYQVYGELYDVSDRCLAYLDQLEGVARGLYVRTFVKVLLPDGRLVEEVIAYRYLQSTAECEPVGSVWPIRELSRYRLEGHSLKEHEAEVEVEGVALWNKPQDKFVTGVHVNEEALRRSCMMKRNKFGARVGQDEAWSPQWFESRLHKTMSTKKQIQLDDSPEFETRDDLAEWAADHLTFFGGCKGSKDAWLKVLAEAAPIIHEE